MIVAIDGPAGSGKSTVARALAARARLTYLDTGAMYRAVTAVAHRRGIEVADAEAIGELARSIELGLIAGEDGVRIFADGVELTHEIRTPEVDADVSAVAAVPAVREAMVAQQRRLAEGADVVAEGRDIGTVVFPKAEVKVFLTAEARARARRRAVQRAGGDTAKDSSATAGAAAEQAVESELVERDRKDSTRAVSPLACAPNAHRIDSTDLTLDEVVGQILELVEEARS